MTRADAAEALRALRLQLDDLTRQGDIVPCAGSPMPLSEDADERQLVARRWCPACPALTHCRDAGRHQRFGTWGGKDRTTPTNRTKEAS